MTAVDAAVEQRPVFDVFEGFALASVLAALDEAGLLAELEAGPVASAPAGVPDPDRLMGAALRYLAQRELVQERDGGFALTERGRAIVKDKGYLVWLQGGYGHVLAGLGDFITGARRYGTGIERAGRWVADGSALIGRDDVAPYAVDVLSGIAFQRVVDLGCGNARFLIGAAQRFGVSGLGVDLSPEAVQDAERRIAEAELAGTVAVRCGDAGELDAIPELREADLAVAHFLLHEIFEHGKEALIAYLTKLGGMMPRGAHMLVAEVQPASGAPDERWRPEFTLLHAIMRQELLDAAGWHEAFTAAGWSRHEVRDLGLPGAVLLLYRNDNEGEA